MAFDFQKAIRESAEQTSRRELGAVILGSSGAGKSSLLGTSGLPTLLLYFSGESHGVKAAQASSDMLTSICVDSESNTTLSADASYDRLLGILNSPQDIKKLGTKFLAVDGLTELEQVIRGTTKWRTMCQSTSGKHNSFAEPASTIAMVKPVLSALQNLQRSLGIHYATTLILDVTLLGPNGEIEEAKPRLQGYSVAEAILQTFGDVVPVGRMSKGNEIKYKLQFMTDLSKVSKDERGTIKKSMNFGPRIEGKRDLPDLMDASLKDLIAFKMSK